jgi:hypothetical protein
MTTVITIGISVAALIISVLSLYFSHLRTKHDLRAVVLETKWSEDDYAYRIRFLFVNNGTHTEVIAGINLNFHFPDEAQPNYIDSYLDLGFDPFLVKLDPLVLEAGVKVIKEFDFPLNREKLDQIVQKTNNEHLPVPEGALKFKVINHKGYWYKPLYFRGWQSPDSSGKTALGFVPDAVIDLNPRTMDRLLFEDQDRRVRTIGFRRRLIARLRHFIKRA